MKESSQIAQTYAKAFLNRNFPENEAPGGILRSTKCTYISMRVLLRRIVYQLA